MEGELSQGDLEGDQKLKEILQIQPRPSLVQRQRPELLPSQPSTGAIGQLAHMVDGNNKNIHLATILSFFT